MSARQIEILQRVSPIAGLTVACGLGVYLLYMWVTSVPIVDLRL